MFKTFFSISLLGLLFCTTGISKAAAQDALTLQNGAVLEGQILYFDQMRTQIRTPQGMRVLPTNRIAEVRSPNRVIHSQLSEIVAQGSDFYQPSMAQNLDTTTRVVTRTPEPVPAAPLAATSAEDITSESDKLWGAKWSGAINLGADLKTGNSESNGVNADAEIKAKWVKHSLMAEAEYNREEDDGDVNVDNRLFKLKHDYFFNEKWFVESSGKYEQDDIANVDYRATLASGLGYQPYDRDDLSLKFVLGPGYQFEEFENGQSEDSLIGKWALDYTQKFYDDLFRLFHNHDLSAPSEDMDAWLFQSESGIRVPIRRGIVATGEIDFDWDNDPAPGTKEDDTTYAVKLGYEW